MAIGTSQPEQAEFRLYVDSSSTAEKRKVSMSEPLSQTCALGSPLAQDWTMRAAKLFQRHRNLMRATPSHDIPRPSLCHSAQSAQKLTLLCSAAQSSRTTYVVGALVMGMCAAVALLGASSPAPATELMAMGSEYPSPDISHPFCHTQTHSLTLSLSHTPPLNLFEPLSILTFSQFSLVDALDSRQAAI